VPRKPRIKFIGPPRPKKTITTSATKAKIPLNKYQIKTTGVTQSQAANIQYRPISKKLKLGDLGYKQQKQLKAKASIEKQGFKLDTKTGEILDPKKLRPPVLRTATPVGELTIPIKRTDKNYRVKTKLEPIAKIKPKVIKTKNLPKPLVKNNTGLSGTKKVINNNKVFVDYDPTQTKKDTLVKSKKQLLSVKKSLKDYPTSSNVGPPKSQSSLYKTGKSIGKVNKNLVAVNKQLGIEKIAKLQEKTLAKKFLQFTAKRVASKALGPAGLIGDLAESVRLTKSIGGHLKRIFVGPKKPNWSTPKVDKAIERNTLSLNKGTRIKTQRIIEPVRPFPREKSMYDKGPILRNDPFLRNTSTKKPITSTNIAEKVKTFKLKPTPLKRVSNPMVSTPLGKDGITRYSGNKMTRK
jgi:hypothetical protein